MVLVGFILVQVFYHIAAIIGFRLLAKGFLEPLSMATLLFFGVMYIISMWKIKKRQRALLFSSLLWYGLDFIMQKKEEKR